jgi:TolB protein
MKYLSLCLAIALGLVAAAAQAPAPPQTASPQQQPTEIATTINGESGAPPRLAVPGFIPLTNDAETAAAARTVTDVLWNDLNYEHEFTFVARDIYTTIPVQKSLDDVPFDRWREVNADGVVAGTVQKSGTGFVIRYRLFDVKNRRAVPGTGQEYSGSSNARRYAHTIADEIFLKQRSLQGVARTKLSFTSDRDGERLSGTIENRSVKEIYIADYDGENQQRVTVGRTLNAFPSWSPDGRSIAYVSWRRGQPNIFVSHIYEGTLDEITKNAGENYLPAWSPDGTRIAFSSTRDGHAQIYVANRDGSSVRRLTNGPSLDSTPTWSPKGNEIAFTSDRSGAPQIYLVSADGLGGVQKLTAESYADRPTWSGETNEIAFESRTGTRFDIKIIDMNTRTVKQLTFSEGSNESPVFAPNGRHIAFMSDRSGKFQIYTMTRDGRDVRQLTRSGTNTLPSWSH